MTLEYVARRFAFLMLTVLLGITINFMIPRLTPGDPVEQKLNQVMSMSGGQAIDLTEMVAAYRQQFGLDQPLWKQYFNYLRQLARLDLGYSLDRYPERVSSSILAALPWTLGLLGGSTLISFTLGTLLGGLLAWPSVPRGVRSLIPGLMVISAIPYYILGLLLLFLFAIVVKAFPVGGGHPAGTVMRFDWPTIVGLLHHASLPALSIILAGLGSWAIAMRGMVVSILGEDYITLAEAKGLRQRRIFTWYAMRNAMLPQTTTLALTLSNVVAGAILVEVIFNYPGLGYLLFQAITTKDYFVIQGIVLLIIVAIAVVLFLLDLIYPLIDPRIVYERRG